MRSTKKKVIVDPSLHTPERFVVQPVQVQPLFYLHGSNKRRTQADPAMLVHL